MRITVIYPAYNEEKNIRSTLRRSLRALRSQFHDFEILVIDDASRDGTRSIAESVAVRNPEIRVIGNARNLGQGGTLAKGFRLARGDLVIHNGMDYPFDLNDLRSLLPLMKDADIVVAARKNRPRYTPLRVLMSLTNVTLLRFLFGLKLRDFNFVQLYKRDVLRTVPFETRSTAFITPEILIRAHDMGYRIREVAVDYHPREHGKATSGRPRVVMGSIRDMMCFWWTRRKAST